jgi:hypothetical protein
LKIAMPDEVPEKTPDLSISLEKVCYIIAKAPEFDAKDVVIDPDDASNPSDDKMISVLGITATTLSCRRFPPRFSP